MADDSFQSVRYHFFTEMLEKFDIGPGDYDEDCEEDIRQYLKDCSPIPTKLARYAVITWSIVRGELQYYVYPRYDSLESAIERAEQFQNDDIAQEFPKSILDLDAGLYMNAEVAASWGGWTTDG